MNLLMLLAAYAGLSVLTAKQNSAKEKILKSANETKLEAAEEKKIVKSLECFDEIKMTQNESSKIFYLLDNIYGIIGEEYSCLMNCILEKKGLIWNGGAQKSTMIERFSKYMSLDKLEPIMKECNVLKGNDICDSGYQIFLCYDKHKDLAPPLRLLGLLETELEAAKETKPWAPLECFDEIKMTQNESKEIYYLLEFIYDIIGEEYSCLMNCILEKKGLIWNGVAQKSTMIESFSEFMSLDKLEPIMKECNVLKGNDICDSGYQIFLCYDKHKDLAPPLRLLGLLELELEVAKETKLEAAKETKLEGAKEKKLGKPTECFHEVKMPDDGNFRIYYLLDYIYSFIGEEYSCLMNCILEKKGLIWNGVAQESTMIERFSEYMSMYKLEPIMKECNALKGKDICDSGYQIFLCYDRHKGLAPALRWLGLLEMKLEVAKETKLKGAKEKKLGKFSECFHDFKLPDDRFFFINNDIYDSTIYDKYSCLMNCILEKEGLILNGVAQESTMIKRFSKYMNLDKLEPIMKECNARKGMDICDSGYQIFECYQYEDLAPPLRLLELLELELEGAKEKKLGEPSECFHEVKMPDDENFRIYYLLNHRYPFIGEEYNCLMNCILEKKRLIWNGVAQESIMIVRFSKYLRFDKLETIMKECNAFKGKNNCETGYLIFLCYDQHKELSEILRFLTDKYF